MAFEQVVDSLEQTLHVRSLNPAYSLYAGSKLLSPERGVQVSDVTVWSTPSGMTGIRGLSVYRGALKTPSGVNAPLALHRAGPRC